MRSPRSATYASHTPQKTSEVLYHSRRTPQIRTTPTTPERQAHYPPPQATTVVQTILEAARHPIAALDILSVLWGAGRGCKVGRAGNVV
jgi:hypothetical protein